LKVAEVTSDVQCQRLGHVRKMLLKGVQILVPGGHLARPESSHKVLQITRTLKQKLEPAMFSFLYMSVSLDLT
jgi:hypothetical protein